MNWKKAGLVCDCGHCQLPAVVGRLLRYQSSVFAKHFLDTTMASSPYFPLAVLFVAALGFGLAPLGLAWVWAMLVSPAKPNAVKNAIYECGLESKGDAWVQFRSAYYLYAIIFLIFDVEAIFLLPFAVAFTGLGVGACLAMLVFVLLLAEGLAWAWAKGILTWA
jgi:NADH:ubiquinone oxidoreductase subunit 3 (subunit A)